jgi:hypothetical protein
VREGFEEVKTLLFEVIVFEVIETIVNPYPHPGTSHLYIAVLCVHNH